MDIPQEELPMAPQVRPTLVSQLSQMSGKGAEIEKEWQKIQQGEYDAKFAFDVLRGNDDYNYAYKKGLADGVRWCIARFSHDA